VKTRAIFISDHAASMMVCLWYAGKNTADIAKELHFPESEIANRLSFYRARHKQMREAGNVFAF
jgi:hypothetical protein